MPNAYQIDWRSVNNTRFDTFVLFADSPEDADTKAREVLSKKYPGKYVYTVLRVVRSGEYEVLPDKDFEK